VQWAKGMGVGGDGGGGSHLRYDEVSGSRSAADITSHHSFCLKSSIHVETQEEGEREVVDTLWCKRAAGHHP